MPNDNHTPSSAAADPYPEREAVATEDVSRIEVSEQEHAAGLAGDQVGRDLDMQHGAYGRDGGAQDRLQDAGGGFGQAGIDTTTGRGASSQD